MDEERGIGKDNRTPWHLSADLKRFKQLTMGHHILMGRKTFESIGRPLPGRSTIIITRQPEYQAEGCLVAHSLDQALSIARDRGESELFVIGGGEIYTQALPVADRIYLTEVQTRVQADVYFPDFDPAGWDEINHVIHCLEDNNEYAFTYRVLERKKRFSP
jgi:dihydrofolate reductase